jgi:hypothetical protein
VKSLESKEVCNSEFRALVSWRRSIDYGIRFVVEGSELVD